MNSTQQILRTASAVVALSLIAAPAIAGDVDTETKGGRLILEAEDDSSILVTGEGFPPTSLRVEPGGGTTLDGSGDAQTFEDVSSLEVQFADGSNSLVIDGVWIDGGLRVLGEDGFDDVAIVKSRIGKRATFDLGPGGCNVVFTSSSEVSGSVSVHGGPQSDFFQFTDRSRITGTLTVDLDEGNDTGEISNDAIVDRNARLSAEGTFCTWIVFGRAWVGGSVSVRGGDGGDQLIVDSFSTIAGRVHLDLGDGENLMDVDDGSLIPRGITVKGGEDRDSVFIRDQSRVGGNSKLTLADGDNEVGLDGEAVIEGSLSVRAGEGNDDVTVQSGSRVEKNLSVDVGDDVNTVVVSSFPVRIGGKTSIRGEGGNDTVVFADATFVGPVSVRVDDGSNSVQVNDTDFFGSFSVRAGDGTDVCQINGESHLRSSGKVQLGDGENVLAVASAFFEGKFSFSSGEDGDDVFLQPGLFAQAARFALGAGENQFDGGESTFASSLTITAGNDDDVIDLSNIEIDGKLKVQAKKGTDTILEP